ncbi:MAG: DinB family protein, partial [Bryobacteraceae bacterium]
MNETADRLLEIVNSAEAELAAMSEADSERGSAGRWCAKEVLGHLIDSAANNHQRFVRAQLQESLAFPGYDTNGWNRVQQYRAASWARLVELWAAYNRHVAHVMRGIPAEAASRVCRIGDGEPVTLSFLATDYVRHL